MKTMILLFVTTIILQAQTATELSSKSLKLLRENKIEEAFDAISEAIEKDTSKLEYYYYKAVILSKQKKFQKAIDLLEPRLNNDSVKDYHYQLVASSYDIIGSKKKAIDLLEKGISRFYDSGRLYYELGIAQLGANKREEAYVAWELGIQKAPNFDGNYYYLCHYPNDLTNKSMSYLYGEIFTYIATNPEKAKKTSKKLYNILDSSLIDGKIIFADITDWKSLIETSPIDIAIAYYMQKASKDLLGKKISLLSINNLRKAFIVEWFKDKKNEQYPCELFDYLKMILDKGNDYFETNTMMVHSEGNLSEFSKWLDENEQKFEKCSKYLQKNTFYQYLTDKKRYKD